METKSLSLLLCMTIFHLVDVCGCAYPFLSFSSFVVTSF